MPESRVCLNAQASLLEITALKKSFDQIYDSTILSNDISSIDKIHEIKSSLSSKILVLDTSIWSERVERTLNLRAQYDAQVKLLKNLGCLKSRMERSDDQEKREVFFMTNIDNKVCPIPSFSDILNRLREKRELLDIKMDQGFTKLLLIPFGMSLEDVIGMLRVYMIRFKQRSAAFSDEPDPVRIWQEGYDMTEQAASIVYEPKTFDAKHQGKSKREAVLDQDWRILLLQSAGDGKGIAPIPHEGTGEQRGKKHIRMDIEQGKTLTEQLKMVIAFDDPSSPYIGESGMTPEDWIMAFIAHMEETENFLDYDALGTGAALVGAYAPSLDRAFVGYSSSETVNLNTVPVDDTLVSGDGIRTVVRI